MKENKGVTLVALVITIIVMLILLAVSVTIIIRSDILKTAKGAAENYKTQAELEGNLSNVIVDGKEYNSLEDYINELEEETEKNPEQGGSGENPEQGGSGENNNPPEDDTVQDTTAPSVDFRLGTPTRTTYPVTITLSNLTEGDYPITVEYYSRLFSEDEDTFGEVKYVDTISSGRTSSFTYSDLTVATKYMFRVIVRDRTGNFVVAEEDGTPYGEATSGGSGD